MTHSMLPPSAPALSAWLFYAGNIVIVAGYLTAAIILTRRRGLHPFASRMRLRTWLSGLGFFLLCGATHAEMAVHTLLDERMIHDDGTVSWHMVGIHVVQAVAIWCFLRYAQSDRETIGDPPLEGTAHAEPDP